jgi:hypothetical protein
LEAERREAADRADQARAAAEREARAAAEREARALAKREEEVRLREASAIDRERAWKVEQDRLAEQAKITPKISSDEYLALYASRAEILRRAQEEFEYKLKIYKKFCETNSSALPKYMRDYRFRCDKDRTYAGMTQVLNYMQQNAAPYSDEAYDIQQIKYELFRYMLDTVNNYLGLGKVFIRIKPYVEKDADQNRPICQRIVLRNKQGIQDVGVQILPTSRRDDPNYIRAIGPFSGVFDENIVKNTEDIFISLQTEILGGATGYNIMILAYGQSQSGKTYTLTNYDPRNPKNNGLLFHTIAWLHKSLGQEVTSVGITMYQTYTLPNTSADPILIDIFKLAVEADKVLVGTHEPHFKKRDCKLYEHFDNIIYSKNVKTRIDYLTYYDLFKDSRFKINKNFDASTVVKIFGDYRLTRSTPMNRDSSRSHAFIDLKVTWSNKAVQHIVFVDLCGNESPLAFLDGGVVYTSTGGICPAESIGAIRDSPPWNESLVINAQLLKISDIILPCMRRDAEITNVTVVDATYWRAFIDIFDKYLNFSSHTDYTTKTIGTPGPPCQRGKLPYLGDVSKDLHKILLIPHVHGYFKSDKRSKTIDGAIKSDFYMAAATCGTIKFAVENSDMLRANKNIQTTQLANSVELFKAVVALIEKGGAAAVDLDIQSELDKCIKPVEEIKLHKDTLAPEMSQEYTPSGGVQRVSISHREPKTPRKPISYREPKARRR